MKVFMSDLHIGSPLFKSYDLVLELYNDPKVEEIYILGDLFDTWEKNAFSSVRKSRYLIDVINNSGKTKAVIKGNHDPNLWIMKEILKDVYVTLSHSIYLFDKKTLLIHGDEFDRLIDVSKIWFPIHYTLQRVGLNIKATARNAYHYISRIKKRQPYNSIVFRTEEKIVDYYGPEYDIIISGHTHMPKLIQLSNCFYVNCGSLVYKPTYVVVDKNTIDIKGDW